MNTVIGKYMPQGAPHQNNGRKLEHLHHYLQYTRNNLEDLKNLERKIQLRMKKIGQHQCLAEKVKKRDATYVDYKDTTRENAKLTKRMIKGQKIVKEQKWVKGKNMENMK